MLKYRLKQHIPLIIALILVTICAGMMMIYAEPMDDISLDLSLHSNEDILEDDGSEYDDKGWTVYIHQGESVAELIPDGFGGYSGLELGQTFYFSRVMEEELDSPTLQLSPGESCFAVWLDDLLIYTDCAELDNRIGFLTLPMNEWYRSEPIVISLPADYHGRTLTIAQSSPEYMETSYVKAWPASVRLYCGYAYESSLISETYRMSLAAAQAFLMAMLMLLIFVRNRDWAILCLAVIPFIWMGRGLMDTSFFYKYFGDRFRFLETVFPVLYTLALVVFLTLRSGSNRRVMAALAGVHTLAVIGYSIVVSLLPSLPLSNFVYDFFINIFPHWAALAAMICILVLAAARWQKENWFYRVFTPMAFITVPVCMVLTVWVAYRGILWEQLALTLSSGQIQMICLLIQPGITVAAMITAIAEAVKAELDRRRERQWIEQHQEMAMASYENLRIQHQEVMMLRHDMMKHFSALRELENTPQAAAYLDQLIGDNEKVRPVVQSGNRMFDLIVNSKIASASARGIKVEIIRSDIAKYLPLKDPELCSLIMNLLDNAIAAASAVAREPQITLDMHMKPSFFVFTCTNSAEAATNEVRSDDVLPRHGMGQKIVQRIAESYDCLLQTTRSESQYSVTVAIPLSKKDTK